MRFREIIESVAVEKRQRQEQARLRAREQLASAEKKRSDAARKYQDEVNDARSSADKARQKIKASSVTETSTPEVASDTLAEGQKAVVLRDRSGSLLGWLEPVGSILQARDRKGAIVGWYDGRQDQTRDKTGTLIGSGNLLAALLMCKARR